ncbi:DUF7344 domain-containing protein [Halostella pelagica]|uniref:DUF7344 domain-containing protein n=1 Tax=Halostella pelagica TaxID=2583824 RepID=UPI0010820694|nr:hypothetical protein [Halostella pelagica]
MSDQETPAGITDTISPDAIYELLADRRRRITITCLNEYGNLALADLAEEVASQEQNASITEVSEEEVRRVYLSLWHSHIPKLAEVDVVAYCQNRDIVQQSENAEQVERIRRRETPVDEAEA